MNEVRGQLTTQRTHGTPPPPSPSLNNQRTDTPHAPSFLRTLRTAAYRPGTYEGRRESRSMSEVDLFAFVRKFKLLLLGRLAVVLLKPSGDAGRFFFCFVRRQHGSDIDAIAIPHADGVSKTKRISDAACTGGA